MNSLIKSAIILDKKSEFHNKKVDILVQNGIISDISENIKNPKNLKEINLPNLHISAGGLIIVFALASQVMKKEVIFQIHYMLLQDPVLPQ